MLHASRLPHKAIRISMCIFIWLYTLSHMYMSFEHQPVFSTLYFNIFTAYVDVYVICRVLLPFFCDETHMQ